MDGWNDRLRQGPAQHLVRPPAEDRFGLAVPAGDPAASVHADHRVEGAAEDGAEATLACRGAAGCSGAGPASEYPAQTEGGEPDDRRNGGAQWHLRSVGGGGTESARAGGRGGPKHGAVTSRR